LTVAEGLPQQAGAALAEAARTAFTQGLRLTAAIGAVLSIGLAILVVALLRQLRASGSPTPSEGEAPEAADPGAATVPAVVEPGSST
jgi:DHA2 family multidrug resistance protein-like MFS transporter